jgi:hypothetical protein
MQCVDVPQNTLLQILAQIRLQLSAASRGVALVRGNCTSSCPLCDLDHSAELTIVPKNNWVVSMLAA